MRQGALVGERTAERGDLERGFVEADIVVEAEYRTQTVVHNSMETHVAVCEWEARDRLTVYISTQFIWGVARRGRALRIASGSRARRLPLHGWGLRSRRA